MPVATTFAAVSARAMGFTSKRSPRATYRVGYSYTLASGAPQAVSFSGASAGDLAIIFTEAVGSNTLSGWTQVGPLAWPVSFNDYMYSKVLDASDISAGSVTITGGASGGTIGIAIYTGATAATVKTSDTSVLSTLPLAGFTPAVNSVGVVSYCSDQSGSASIGSPTGMVNRLSFSTSIIASSLSDFLSPNTYTSGATVTWTGMAGFANTVGRLIELTV